MPAGRAHARPRGGAPEPRPAGERSAPGRGRALSRPTCAHHTQSTRRASRPSVLAGPRCLFIRNFPPRGGVRDPSSRLLEMKGKQAESWEPHTTKKAAPGTECII
ncbi:uncharacterized protein PS065_004690 [Dugong dugon]